jgi:hypothetical protein
MNDRIRTLLLEANGTHWAAVALDTIGQGVFTAREGAPAFITSSRILRKLFAERYGDASYMADWREAFCENDELSVDICNITNLLEWHSYRKKINTYDLIVVLHSAAGDRMGILNRTAHWFDVRRGKLAMFVGNEYDLMGEKISFINQSGADYVCTQLPLDVARTLYAGCTATVLPTPHALNPRVYTHVPGKARTVDVGFVGDLYDRLIGDQERTRIVNFISRDGARHGLRCDVRRQRMPRCEWARYLNACHGIVGAESGTYFLQRNGQALSCAKALLKREPKASFEAVFEACFAKTGPKLNGKAISSRHFEPIGTRTCQLLIEGAYNGILEADRHYIAVRRDLSNVADAVGRFKDVAFRAQITTAAYEHVIEGHTYSTRVARFVDTVRTGQPSTPSD